MPAPLQVSQNLQAPRAPSVASRPAVDTSPVRLPEAYSLTSGVIQPKSLSDGYLNNTTEHSDSRQSRHRKISPVQSLPAGSPKYSPLENTSSSPHHRSAATTPLYVSDLSASTHVDQNTGPLQGVEHLIQPNMISSNNQGPPRLYYAEPLTRLDSRPQSTASDFHLPPPPLQNSLLQPQHHKDTRSVRIIPTRPSPPNDQSLSSPQSKFSTHNPKRWRLTQFSTDEKDNKRLPRITLVKYKIEDYSNNFIQEEDSRQPYREGRRSLSPPLNRNSPLLAPGRRLSIISGNNKSILKVMESTPLTPVAVAPDVTQFLFPEEVQAINNGTTLPRIDNRPATSDTCTQTNTAVSSYTQTDDNSFPKYRKHKKPNLHKFHSRSHKLSSDSRHGARPLESYSVGLRVKRRSSSMGPNWRV